jgi:hypothetical protein
LCDKGLPTSGLRRVTDHIQPELSMLNLTLIRLDTKFIYARPPLVALVAGKVR